LFPRFFRATGSGQIGPICRRRKIWETFFANTLSFTGTKIFPQKMFPQLDHSLRLGTWGGSHTKNKRKKGFVFGPFLLRLQRRTVCSTAYSHEWCSVVMIVGLGDEQNTLMFEITSDKCTQNNRFSRRPSKRIKPVTSNQ